MTLVALNALTRFHRLEALAGRGEDLVIGIRGFGGDRPQMLETTRAWADEILGVRSDYPEAPDPSAAADLIAEHWANKDVLPVTRGMLAEEVNRTIGALRAVAFEPFKDQPESVQRFVLLHELYEAHKNHAGIVRDGSLYHMFDGDVSKIDRWIKWAREQRLVDYERDKAHGRPLLVLNMRGIDVVEDCLVKLKRDAERATQEPTVATVGSVRGNIDMIDHKKPRVFIGSSVEGKAIAEQIQLGLDYDAECTLWWQGVFGLSSGTLESLVRAAKEFEFAVLVLTPDDLVSKRDSAKNSPRDNVIFELGLFMGALGRERTYIVHCRDEKPDLPTDLAGVVPATFAKRSDGNLHAATGAVCTLIKNAINAVLAAERSS